MSRLLLAAVTVSLSCFAFVGAPRAQRAAVAEDKAQAPDESTLSPKQKANVAVLDAMLKIVREQFYDRKHGGKNLDDLRARYLKRVADSEPGTALHAALKELIAEFKVSHFTIIEEEAYTTNFGPEMDNTTSLRLGVDLSELEPGKLFVTSVLDGSGAQKAGVLRGDRLLEVNGKPALESGTLVDAGGDPGLPGVPHYYIRIPGDRETMDLKLQRSADDAGPVAVTVTPTQINAIQASKSSVTVIEYQGRKFGYIHFWHFLHMGMAEALSRAIRKTWTECDGAIIDLRGRGGSPAVMNACFAPFAEPPAMGMRMGGGGYNMPRWDRPVVALQDSGSRSAKEVYAHNWKWQKVGPLVGESTPGAVLGSTFAQLPDGSYLLFPAQNVRSLTYGQVELEGNPVEPTHPVKDLLPFAAGADTIKQAGIKVLYDLVKDKPAYKKPEPEQRPHEEKEEEFSLAPAGDERWWQE
ncbi:MAG: PDZ domain-containing protein [Planctomycetes bacterium]|nr:PDZ domain-containing protein [Planctomycetota bacterium]